MNKKVTLKTKRDGSVRGGHPWIFSGAIKLKQGGPREGDVVAVYSDSGDLLGYGHYGESSIAVKMLSVGDAAIDEQFWQQAFQRAYDYRQSLGFFENIGSTNAYRLVNAEGDGLPGLIVDIYGDAAVVQCHSMGMHAELGTITKQLQRLYGDKLRTIYDKSATTLQRETENESNEESKVGNFLLGQAEQGEIVEHRLRYSVDWVNGQKTGFFLDQRDNRACVRSLAHGRKVLNAFCYTGAFSVAALAGGAAQVDSVDVSKRAVEMTNANVALNSFTDRHEGIAADCFHFLGDIKGKYDLIILDPPAFAKHRNAVDRALRGYRSINRDAFRGILPGGLLLTFSCSQLVDRESFRRTVQRAAYESGRDVQVIKELAAGACHPSRLAHPEGEYLKGLLLHVH